MEQEATCPICLECLTDPLVLNCGHSFCQSCITNYCEKWKTLGSLKCPVCKIKFQKGDFRPNWQLANLIEKMKLIPLSSVNDLCSSHKEKLHLFCKEDEKLVCFVCEHSSEHQGHTILLLEEAAQQHKDKILICLETLRTEREKILGYLADAEDESQEILKIVESERQKTVAEFRNLRDLLKEQENCLLGQIEEVEKEIARKRNDHLASLSEELSSLEILIQEMEEKHQQPVNELLQDVRSSLQRCKEKEKFENPVVFSSDLKWRLTSFCDIGPFLGSIMKQFKDTLVSELQMQKAKVTLGLTSADSKLILSADRRSIKYQHRPEDPGNIYTFSKIWGSEGFKAGCHFWEVLVGSEDGWAVGVGRKPVKRRFLFTPEDGTWVVGRWQGQYEAFIMGICPPLNLHGELKRIRISLNYDLGQVSFFDADRGALLYKFSAASFSGDTLHPFFAVYDKGYIRLCP